MRHEGAGEADDLGVLVAGRDVCCPLRRCSGAAFEFVTLVVDDRIVGQLRQDGHRPRRLIVADDDERQLVGHRGLDLLRLGLACTLDQRQAADVRSPHADLLLPGPDDGLRAADQSQQAFSLTQNAEENLDRGAGFSRSHAVMQNHDPS